LETKTIGLDTTGYVVYLPALIAITNNLAGRPGVDYPILSAVPYTNFYCDEQAYPGFFADMETRCQGE